jgi:hypothetical protein
MKTPKRASGEARSDDKPALKKAKARPLASVDARLEIISGEQADTSPSVPVKIALLEAKRLLAAMRSRRKALAALPHFDTGALEDFGGLVRALRGREHEAQRAARHAGSRAVRDARKRAKAWRAEVVAAARFLLRNDPRAASELDAIDGGEGVASLVADLDDLLTLVGAHASDFALLPEPVYLAAGAPHAAALRSGAGDATEEVEVTEALRARNRAFWALEACAAEVRAGVAYLLRDDPKKLAAMLMSQPRVRRPAPKPPDRDDDA